MSDLNRFLHLNILSSNDCFAGMGRRCYYRPIQNLHNSHRLVSYETTLIDSFMGIIQLLNRLNHSEEQVTAQFDPSKPPDGR
jgi:hypothetical protein